MKWIILMSVLSKEKFAELLDRMALGGPTQKIAEDVGVGRATVQTYDEEYPLWGYLRKQFKDGRKNYDKA